MGVTFSHDCFSGPHSLFGRFRVVLARTIGIYLPAMEGYEDGVLAPKAFDGSLLFPDGISWDNVPKDPLVDLLTIPDDGGEIPWKKCSPLAKRIREVIPRLENYGENEGYGTWKEIAEKFAKGLHAAYETKTNVEYG